MRQVQIRLLSTSETSRPVGVMPTKSFPTDAGWDLYPTVELTLMPGQRALIPTGLAMAIPPGYYGRIAERSGYGNRGLGVGAGVIDAGYRDEIRVVVYNRAFFDDNGAPNNQPMVITPGKAIAQIIFERCDPFSFTIVNELPAADRGLQGFGSSDQ